MLNRQTERAHTVENRVLGAFWHRLPQLPSLAVIELLETGPIRKLDMLLKWVQSISFPLQHRLPLTGSLSSAL